MTEDDIKQLLKEANFRPYALQENAVRRFASLVSAYEREACARVCEPQEKWDDPLTAWTIAAAIRARGNND